MTNSDQARLFSGSLCPRHHRNVVAATLLKPHCPSYVADGEDHAYQNMSAPTKPRRQATRKNQVFSATVADQCDVQPNTVRPSDSLFWVHILNILDAVRAHTTVTPANIFVKGHPSQTAFGGAHTENRIQDHRYQHRTTRRDNKRNNDTDHQISELDYTRMDGTSPLLVCSHHGSIITSQGRCESAV